MKDLYLYINESILDIDDNIEHVGDIAVVKNFINENYTIRNYNGPANFDIRTEKTKDGKFIVDAQYCDVTVTNKDIKSLTNNMFVWGIVGNFYCKDCFKLNSLEGSPIQVNWNFSCEGCDMLTTLKGAPLIVKLSFSCKDCMSLKSLVGAPEKTETFDCGLCQSLKSLKGSPRELERFDCTGCISLVSLNGAPKKVTNTFKCSDCGMPFDDEYIRKHCGNPKYIYTW